MIQPDPLEDTLSRLGDAEEEIESLRRDRDNMRYELRRIAGTFGHEYDPVFGATLEVVQSSLANRAAMCSWTCEDRASCGTFRVAISPRVGDVLRCSRCEAKYRVTEVTIRFGVERIGDPTTG